MNSIPIVLTATIRPTVDAFCTHSDPVLRKNEYLEAIAYYRRYAKVYFLENSGYPLLQDPDFPVEDETFRYVTFDRSPECSRGKGYQEFSMLDRFVSSHLPEKGFIKVTGRYIYTNFDAVYGYARERSAAWDVIVDAYRTKSKAFSSLFYVSRESYARSFMGMFKEMNDGEGCWAEHVMYRRLARSGRYGFFRPLPLLKMISGADGVVVDYSRRPAVVLVKNIERRLLSLGGARRLFF